MGKDRETDITIAKIGEGDDPTFLTMHGWWFRLKGFHPFKRFGLLCVLGGRIVYNVYIVGRRRMQNLLCLRKGFF